MTELKLEIMHEKQREPLVFLRLSGTLIVKAQSEGELNSLGATTGKVETLAAICFCLSWNQLCTYIKMKTS